MKRFRQTLCVLILTVIAGCKEFYDPVICNGYDEPVRLVFSLTTGRHSEVVLPVGGIVYAGIRKNERCLSLLVFSTEGSILAAYSEGDVIKRRSKVQTQGDAWLVSSNGLFVINDKQLRDWRQNISAIEAQSRQQ